MHTKMVDYQIMICINRWTIKNIFAVTCFCIFHYFCTPSRPPEIGGLIIADALLLPYGDTMHYTFVCDSSFAQRSNTRCPDCTFCVCFQNGLDSIEILAFDKIKITQLDTIKDIKERVTKKYSWDYQGEVNNFYLKKISQGVYCEFFDVKNNYLYYRFMYLYNKDDSLSVQILYRSKMWTKEGDNNFNAIKKSFKYTIKRKNAQ